MPRSYDPACEELARHFLSDEEFENDHVAELAQHIQDAIEDWIEAKRIALDEAVPTSGP